MEGRICFGVIVMAPSAHGLNAERLNVDLQASWRGGHPVDRDRNTKGPGNPYTDPNARRGGLAQSETVGIAAKRPRLYRSTVRPQ
jgi:hypothetical protein